MLPEGVSPRGSPLELGLLSSEPHTPLGPPALFPAIEELQVSLLVNPGGSLGMPIW